MSGSVFFFVFFCTPRTRDGKRGNAVVALELGAPAVCRTQNTAERNIPSRGLGKGEWVGGARAPFVTATEGLPAGNGTAGTTSG